MKFVIRITRKLGGDQFHLGDSYDTHAEADAFARANVCLRCNRYSIHRVPADWQWRDRRVGFREPLITVADLPNQHGVPQ